MSFLQENQTKEDKQSYFWCTLAADGLCPDKSKLKQDVSLVCWSIGKNLFCQCAVDEALRKFAHASSLGSPTGDEPWRAASRAARSGATFCRSL
jgi:hypothetical protein